MSNKILVGISVILLIASVLMLTFLKLRPNFSVKKFNVSFNQSSAAKASANPLVDQSTVDFLKTYQGQAIKSLTAQIVTEGNVEIVWAEPVTSPDGIEFKGGLRIKASNGDKTSDILFNENDVNNLLVFNKEGNTYSNLFSELKQGENIRVTKTIDLTKPRSSNTLNISINRI